MLFKIATYLMLMGAAEDLLNHQRGGEGGKLQIRPVDGRQIFCCRTPFTGLI
jgi:hypothetical protein